MDKIHLQRGKRKQLGLKQGGNIGMDLTPTFRLHRSKNHPALKGVGVGSLLFSRRVSSWT